MSITTFRFGRAAAYILVNIYAIKMGAVFMISTSTVIIYTRIVPRLTLPPSFIQRRVESGSWPGRVA